ncbi:cysteine hydrolase family protein [Amycolatopsis sp. MEPSY49]|uniref:cysteine hydrolase family protein n=1 Tax=Amycolatopsis sp. MEPSY49 TaxID=3151600 RepID=UPI003EF2F6D5
MPDRTALLLMDLQPLTVPAFGGDDALLTRLAGAAAAARAAGVDVIHIRIAFRPGYPDVAAGNKIFSAVTGMMDMTESNPDTDVHPGLAPDPADFVVTKRRVSAFSGSDLELLLRSRDVGTLVLAGVSTSGVVLSTLRQAADLDYRLVVLSDGCDDHDSHVHEVLVGSVFPAHAEIATTEEWVAGLGSDRHG